MSDSQPTSSALAIFLQNFENDELDQNANKMKRIWEFAALHGLEYEVARENLDYAEEFDKISKNLLTQCVQATPSIENLNLRNPELIPGLLEEMISQEGINTASKYAEVGCQARASVNQGTSMTPPPPESDPNGDVTLNMSQFYALFDAKSFAEHLKNVMAPSPPEVYKTTYCPFCHKNGEPESSYKTHNLTHPITRAVLCPVLTAYVCKFCGASGEYAHTASYCPFNPANRKKTSRKTSNCDFSDWKHIGKWEC